MVPYVPFLLLYLPLLVLLFATGVISQTNDIDVSALFAMKTALGNPFLLNSWKGDPCSSVWLGITCENFNKEVKLKIDLSDLNINPSLSREFFEKAKDTILLQKDFSFLKTWIQHQMTDSKANNYEHKTKIQLSSKNSYKDISHEMLNEHRILASSELPSPIILSPPPPVDASIPYDYPDYPPPPPSPSPPPSLSPPPSPPQSKSSPPPPPPPNCSCDAGLTPRPETCDCVGAFLFSLYMQGVDYDSFDNTKQGNLNNGLSSLLGVGLDQTSLLSKARGSVYANMGVFPPSGSDSFNKTTLDGFSSKVSASQVLTLDPSFGVVTVLNSTVPPLTVVPAPPPPKNSSKLSTGAIIGIAAGGGIAVLIFLSILLYCCCAAASNKNDPEEKARESPPRPAWTSKRSPEPSIADSTEPPPPVVVEVSHPPEPTPEPAPAPAPAVISEPIPESSEVLATAAAAVTATAVAVGGPPKKLTSPTSLKRNTSIPGLQAFSVADLQLATNSFSPENKIGEDQFGNVYRGEFALGRMLAVRQMESSLVENQSVDDFKAIIASMSRLRHPNIIEIHGYCTQFGQRLLAFQYFANGTLYDYLHSPQRHRLLTWDVRIRIAIGCAQALEYLHEACIPPVIHHNIRSHVIHIDDDLNPHLGESGMATFMNDASQTLASPLQSGFAYNAPEYALSGTYTTKSDIYSFGVILLELLTGREAMEASRARSEQSLVKWAAPLLHDLDELEAMVDPRMAGPSPDQTTLTRFAEVITRCIQPEPEFRPNISKVVQDLQKRVLRTPKKRATNNNNSN